MSAELTRITRQVGASADLKKNKPVAQAELKSKTESRLARIPGESRKELSGVCDSHFVALYVEDVPESCLSTSRLLQREEEREPGYGRE